MFLTHPTQLIVDALLAVAYPQSCAICGGSVEQRRLGVTCDECWKETRIFTGEETICRKCGLLAEVDAAPEFRDEVRCMRCEGWAFTAARAVGPYDGALREAVLRLKRKPHLPSYLEALLLAAAAREPLSDSTKVVPVPLHARRLKTRGFNQAALIARMIARRRGLPLDEVSLERVSGTEKYRAGMDPKGRRETVAGAFVVRHPRLIADEKVLLVDDVFTTGATVSACAEALLAAGARQVFVLTIGRA